LAGIGCADTGMDGGLLQCHEIAIEEDVTVKFRRFALRHPDSKERLRKAFEMSKATNDDAIYESVFGRLTKDRRFDNDLALLALGPIVSSLMLESHFEPENLSKKSLRRILGRIFDALFPARR